MARYVDPRILRAIAHPHRNRILSELYAAGPLRAADIATRADIPANRASFHLRQLAKYGLIVEAPEEARDKRDRVWRLADADGISFRSEDVLAQPGGEAAMDVYRRSAEAWGHLLVDLAGVVTPGGPEKYISNSSLRLTPEEVEEYANEAQELLNRWRQRTQGAGGERELYSIYQLVQPYPDMPGPDEDA
ncbi:MAG: ArsR/SmtB family transcription factor [Marmoricola sp.]